MNGGSLVFDSSVSGHAFTFGGLAASSSGPAYDIILQDNASSPIAVALSVGNNNGDTTYAGVLGGTGSLIKIGTGRLTLTGANTYGGVTTVTAGTLHISAGGALTQTASIGIDSVSPATSAALTIDGSTSIVTSLGDVIVGNSGTGTLNLRNGGAMTVNSGTGTVTLANDANSSGTLNIGAAVDAGTLTAAMVTGGAGTAFVNFNHNNSGYIFAPQLAGSLVVNQLGSGMTILTAANSHTGTTMVSGGTLDLSNQNAVQNSTVILTGGSLVFDSSVSGHAFTFGGLTAGFSGPGYDLALQDNAATTPNAVALSVGNNNATTTYGGVLSGTGSLVKIGTGMLTLIGANTYSGATTVAAGTLQIPARGSLTQTASIGIDSVPPATSATLTIDGNTSNVTSLGGVIVGNSGTGTLNLRNGAAMTVDSGTGTVTLANGTNSSGTLNIGAGEAAATLTAAMVTGGDGTAVVNFNHNDSGYIFAPQLAGSLVVNQLGSGTTILTAANSYTGTTTVSAGTLDLSNQNAVQNSTVMLSGGGLVFDSSVTGNAFTLGGLAASSSGPGYDLALQDNAATTPNAVTLSVGYNNTDTTYAGVLSGQGSLVKIGTGMLTLTGSNIHTGGTQLNAGTLSFANGSLGATGLIDFTGTSTLQWNGNTLDISSRLKIEDGFTATIDTHGNDVNFANTLQTGTLQSGALAKTGTGTLTLAAINNYTGGTFLNQGTLGFISGALDTTNSVDFTGNSTLQWIGNSQDLSSRLKIEDGVTATIDTNGNDVSFGSTLQTGTLQSGALAKTGAGTLALTESNNYSGGTFLNQGTLSFITGALGTTGTIDITGTSTLQWTGSNTDDLSGRLKIEDGVIATVDTNGNDLTFASSLQTGTAQTAALIKTGTGTLTLTAVNTYGTTTVNGGTLQVSTGGVLTQTADTVIVGDTGTAILNLQNGGTMTVNSGTGTVTLANGAGSSGTLNITGAIAGTLTAASVTGGAGTALVNFNHSDSDPGCTFTPALTGSLAANQIGSGTTILTATNSYTGATTVSDGILQVSSTGSITKTSSITIDGVPSTTNATLTVDAGTVTTTGDLHVGNNATGNMNLTANGKVASDTGHIGYNSGANGTVAMDANSTWTLTSNLYVGGSGTGTLTLSDGSSIVSDNGNIGHEQGSTGTVTLDTNSSWTLNGNLHVGENGTGTLHIKGGSVVTTSGSQLSNLMSSIGENDKSVGLVTVDGTGSKLSCGTYVTNMFSVGESGKGTLSITNGGDVETWGGTVGLNGSVTVNGSDSIWNNNYSDLAITGSNIHVYGTLAIQAGGTVVSWGGMIGANGSVTVNGGGSTWKNDKSLADTSTMGSTFNASGTMAIQAGGNVTSFHSMVSGAVTVDGQDSTWKNSELEVGEYGTLEITNGGKVYSDSVSIGEQSTKTTPNIPGTVTVDGTGSELNCSSGLLSSNTLDINGSSTLTITAGGKVSNNDGSINGTSTVTVDGASTWTNSGSLKIESGTLNITNGGQVTSGNGNTALGGDASKNGSVGHDATVTVSGTGSIWINHLSNINSPMMTTSGDGWGYMLMNGTMNLLSGGTLQLGDGQSPLTSNLVVGLDLLSVATLNIGNGGAAGQLLAVEVTSASTVYGCSILNFNHSDDIAFATIISGTFNVNHQGVGTTVLSGSNSYDGKTTISAGTLQLANASATGVSKVIMDGGRLAFDASVTTNAFTLIALESKEAGAGYDVALTDSAGKSVTLTLTCNFMGGEGWPTAQKVDATYAGVLSGSGSLALRGETDIDPGKLTLSGANTYTGTTTVAYGTLILANPLAVQNSTLTMDVTKHGGVLTFDSTVSGQAFTFGGLAAVASENGYNNIALQDNATTPNPVALSVGNNNADTSYAGVLSGSGSLAKIGTGTLTLTEANTYSGTTTVTAGTLTLAGANLCGGATILSGGTLNLANQNAVQNSTVTLNGGTLAFDSSVTGHAFTFGGLAASVEGPAYRITLDDNAATPNAVALTVGNNNADTTYAGRLLGSGSLIKSGSGTLTLSGANTYSGATTITSGALNLSHPNAVQNSTVTMAGGGLVFDSSVTGNAFTFGGLAASSSGPGYDLALANNAPTPNAVALSVGYNNANTGYAGVLSGNGSVTKVGAGTLTLAGANTYSGTTTVTAGLLTLAGANLCSGATTVSGGTLKLANQNAVQNSTVTLNGGALRFDSTVTGHAFTLGGLAASQAGLAYRITLEDNATTPNAVALTVGNNNADTLFAGSLLGKGSLIKSGSGTLALPGQNTYKGATTVTGGMLVIADGGNIAQSASVTVDSTSQGTQAALTVDGMVPSSVTSMGAVTVGASGNGTLTIQNWGMVYVGGRYGTGTLTLASGSGSAGTLNIGSGDAAGMLAAAVVNGGAGTATVNFNHSDDFTFTPQLTGSLAVNQLGSGTTILTAANSHTGTTTISAGTLNLSNQYAVENSTVTMAGGTLMFDSSVSGNAFTFGGLAASSSGPGYDIPLMNNAETPDAVTLSVGYNNTDTAYAGVLSGTGSSLTKIGTGILTLTGGNSYTGGTTIHAGGLSFADGSLGTTGTVDFTGGSTLQWNGTNSQDLSSRMKIEDGAVAIIDTNGNNVTFASALQTGNAHNGILIKTGAGTLSLTTTNNYSGGTHLAAGTVSFVAGALGTAGTVDFTGNATLRWHGTNTQDISGRLKIEDGITAAMDTHGNNVTFANPLQLGIYQTAALTKLGAGTLTLQTANIHKGGTTLGGGTLDLSNQNAVLNSTVAMAGGNLVFDSSVSGNAFTLGGLAASSSGPGYDIALANNAETPAAVALSVGYNNTGTTYAGVLSGPGSLTKTGSGTLALTAANNYTGGTTVSSGTLWVTNTSGSATGTGDVTVSPGATLGGTGTISGATTISGRLAPAAQASGNPLTLGTTTFIGDSIFAWELNATNGADPGVIANAGTYGQVAAGTTTGTTVFTIVLGTNSYADAFWNTNKTWNNIFTSSGTSDLSTVFASFDGAGLVNNGNGGNAVATVPGRGYFSFNGSSTLSWTAVPEPTTALTGLLLGAGLLRRRRTRNT